MLELMLIQETAMQVADAITAVLEIDTEIVDAHLRIVSGTGRFNKRIGTFEEGGDVSSDEYYAEILRTGEEKICLDTTASPAYHPMEGERSEITCPIIVDDDVVGLIGLIAFTEEQHAEIKNRTKALAEFLRKMAELLASKLFESNSNHEFNRLIDSAPQGIIATGTDGRVILCNESGEDFLGQDADSLEGKNISSVFPGVKLFGDGQSKSLANCEFNYGDKRLFADAVIIPDVGRMYFLRDDDITSEILLSSLMDSHITFDDIYGSSRAMVEARERARQIADNDSTVLITGESGTGKELFARAIHNAGSRSGKPFVSINCGAIPEALFESELFGYEKGAFTGAASTGKMGKFELADNGTVFVDEFGDMPIHLQVKLLRVLQDREIQRVGGTTTKKVNIRLIAATNKPLEEMVRNNEFRGDLYYRLSVIPLHLPPLRERRGDLRTILNLSLGRFNKLLGKDIRGFEQEALQYLMKYPWPGNIREVENTVEYCVNMESSSMVTINNLPERILRYTDQEVAAKAAREAGPGHDLFGKSLKEQLEHAEKEILRQTLEHTGTDREGKRKAAELLEIGESSLYRKIKTLGI